MPLLDVTGLAATGKSTVLGELRTRGHRAYGVDEDEYADWISRVTGRPEAMPPLPAFDFDSWYQTHDWILSKPCITELSHQAAEIDGPVFLCGVASGDKEVWHLFSKVIALVADLRTLERRIAVRDNLFGKNPEQFADIARWHDGYERAYAGFGAEIVDATRPLDEVVDHILAIADRPAKPQPLGPMSGQRNSQQPASRESNVTVEAKGADVTPCPLRPTG